MKLKFEVEYTPIDSSRLPEATTRAQKILATQVLKDTNPYVPALSTAFSARARVEEEYIVYSGVYARYLWFGKRMVDSATGRGAFYIPDVGFRFNKGATLRATDKDLVFDKSVHPKAQSHWFEASKKDNLEKWLKVSQKAVADEFGK